MVAESFRILAVEDHPVNVALLRAVLASAKDERIGSSELTVAGSLEEARTAVATDAFDAVILDLRLPDGDGLELLGTLRDSRSASAPVIALTANALPADRERVAAAGCTAFLEKPYNPADLIRLLSDLR